MSSSSDKSAAAELLCHVDFPAYCVSAITPRHVLIGGGGGAAKTGVKNGFEVFELSHDGRATRATSVTRHDTGEFAVMNLCAARYDDDRAAVTVAVGHNENCQLYRLELTTDKTGSGATNKANGDVNKNNNGRNGALPRLVFDVEKLKSVQTDYNMPEPYQKVCRLSPNNAYLATGGDDGFLRIWSHPDLYQTQEIEAHQKEIDDIDFSPDNTKLVTISKDRHCFVWDVKKGKKHAEMGWDPPRGTKYMFKRVRFGRVEGDSKRYKVFTISNPVGASKPPSYLQRWDGKTFQLEKSVCSPEGGGSLSALAVSGCGDFVATGSMFDGTVEIFIAFSFQRVRRVEKSHSTFITGLEFLQGGEDSDVVRGFSDASLVSISVDHQVCVHHVPRMRKISITAAFFLMAGLLIVTFIICSYLGL